MIAEMWRPSDAPRPAHSHVCGGVEPCMVLFGCPLAISQRERALDLATHSWQVTRDIHERQTPEQFRANLLRHHTWVVYAIMAALQIAGST